jgi:hypothetical protein
MLLSLFSEKKTDSKDSLESGFDCLDDLWVVWLSLRAKALNLSVFANQELLEVPHDWPG